MAGPHRQCGPAATVRRLRRAEDGGKNADADPQDHHQPQSVDLPLALLLLTLPLFVQFGREFVVFRLDRFLDLVLQPLFTFHFCDHFHAT